MKKVLVLLTFMLFSLASRAQECATDVAGLRNLVGNAGISMNWIETKKGDRQLTLRLSNAGGQLRLKLTNPHGDWADMTGTICKKSDDTFIAKVSKTVWGSEAPFLAKAAGVKTLEIKLPYHTVMNINVKGFKFNFSPL